MYICYKGPQFLVLSWATKISGPALLIRLQIAIRERQSSDAACLEAREEWQGEGPSGQEKNNFFSWPQSWIGLGSICMGIKSPAPAASSSPAKAPEKATGSAALIAPLPFSLATGQRSLSRSVGVPRRSGRSRRTTKMPPSPVAYVQVVRYS